MQGKSKVQSPLEASKAVFQDTTPFLCNFALLSFENSRFLDYIIVFFEYAQLISQGFLINCLLYLPENETGDVLQKFVITPFEPLVPGYLVLDFQEESTRSLIVLGFAFLLMMGKFSLFAYCINIAKNQRISGKENKKFCGEIMELDFYITRKNALFIHNFFLGLCSLSGNTRRNHLFRN